MYLFAVDETITTVEEKEDTQIKPAESGEKAEATPSGQTATSKSPSRDVKLLTMVAEAGGSARHLLANIRNRKRMWGYCNGSVTITT